MPPAAKNAEALLQELFSRSRRQVRITDVLGEGRSIDLHSYLLPTVEPHPTPDQLRPEMLQGWRPPASLGDLSQQSTFPLLEKDTSPMSNLSLPSCSLRPVSLVLSPSTVRGVSLHHLCNCPAGCKQITLQPLLHQTEPTQLFLQTSQYLESPPLACPHFPDTGEWLPDFK